MRVLLVTNVFPPDIGGPATFGARLAEELSHIGHSVKVVCGTPDMDSGTTYPYPVVRAGLMGNSLQRELDIRIRLSLAMLSADIVYCMGLEHQTSWVCNLLRKKYVMRIGGDSVWEGARNLGATDLEPHAYYTDTKPEQRHAVHVPEQRRVRQLERARHVVFVSEYLKMLSQAWIQDAPVQGEIIVNGVISTLKPVTAQREHGEDLRLLFVGRQTNWKGVDSILLAVQTMQGVKLTIAGYGPEFPANVDLCKKLKLDDKVNFLGHVQPTEIMDLMKEHHVLLLPSLYEGLSNTLLEAGIAGLACIASDRGGNPEVLINNKTGLLVNPFEIGDMKKAIISLRDDEEMRVELAANHFERVKTEFPLDRAVSKTIDLLSNASRS